MIRDPGAKVNEVKISMWRASLSIPIRRGKVKCSHRSRRHVVYSQLNRYRSRWTARTSGNKTQRQREFNVELRRMYIHVRTHARVHTRETIAARFVSMSLNFFVNLEPKEIPPHSTIRLLTMRRNEARN